MKTILHLAIFIACLVTTDLVAQDKPAVQPGLKSRQKMEVFKSWTGEWKGEGFLQRGRDLSEKSLVDESIQMKLDGLILVVEGVGKLKDGSGKVVHSAFGVLSYDEMADQYKFKAYLADGRSTDAWFNVVGDNKYQWGFDIPNGGKIRYTITIDPAAKTWNEVGEFSRDEKTWFKTFEMNLTKSSS